MVKRATVIPLLHAEVECGLLLYPRVAYQLSDRTIFVLLPVADLSFGRQQRLHDLMPLFHVGHGVVKSCLSREIALIQHGL